MIAGPPPGRISALFTAWADWLFLKLSPPEPERKVMTHPPKLVRSDADGHVTRVVTANRR
jgi:hypothetical protein